MRRYWTYALHAAGAAAFVLAALYVAGLALPFLADSIRSVRASLPGDGGDSGLIFVESPEVYTRQRLVNDRYLQDSWLRNKLVDIDDEDEAWIDTFRLEQEAAAAFLGAEAEGGGEAPDLPDPSEVMLSFERKFELQSNARDTIRQMILENALDDRHDLSGNTVFGLKFDTSVLPGSRTTLNPTVIVRMEANPLEKLTQPPEALAPHYGGSTLDEAGQATNVTLLRQNDAYFDAWRRNLEERLNGQLLIEKGRWAATDSCGPGALYDTLLSGPLCRTSTTESAAPLAADAATRLEKLFAQSELVDDALAFELRIPARSLTLGRQLQGRVLARAASYCAEPGTEEATIRELFEGDNPRITSESFLLPSPWQALFGMRLNPRLTDSCGVDLDVQLESLELKLFVVPLGRAGEVPFSVLRPLDCTASCNDPDSPVSIWTLRDQLPAAQAVLDPDTLEALIGAGPQSMDRQLCFTETGFYTRPRPADDEGTEADAEDEEDGVADRCGPGWQVDFRVGAFQFLRRMTEVESYTYAAFPRGDVSGVVTETGSGRGAAATVGTPYGQGGFSLRRDERERTTSTLPSVINFAAGDRHELFDFGWSIVKEGVKDPMTASQLVLVSVPAYLDRIELEVIKGFIDVDRLPADWAERRAQDAALRDPPDEEERATLLEQRMNQIADSWERRTLQLKLPPDYEALDGVVIGNNVVARPSINEPAFRPRCVERERSSAFTLAIPGQRLWRSTVVTLDGEKATRIEVMPDMRGILATFGSAEARAGEDSAGAGRRPAGPHELVVWTSEGRSEPIGLQSCPDDGG